MASTPAVLAGYIKKEIALEFDIKNPQTLDRMANAIAKAVHTYITTDVEVEPGIAVQVSPATGTGATIGPGDLF